MKKKILFICLGIITFLIVQNVSLADTESGIIVIEKSGEPLVPEYTEEQKNAENEFFKLQYQNAKKDFEIKSTKNKEKTKVIREKNMDSVTTELLISVGVSENRKELFSKIKDTKVTEIIYEIKDHENISTYVGYKNKENLTNEAKLAMLENMLSQVEDKNFKDKVTKKNLAFIKAEVATSKKDQVRKEVE